MSHHMFFLCLLGGAAFHAGIKAGDHILEINGLNVRFVNVFIHLTEIADSFRKFNANETESLLKCPDVFNKILFSIQGKAPSSCGTTFKRKWLTSEPVGSVATNECFETPIIIIINSIKQGFPTVCHI